MTQATHLPAKRKVFVIDDHAIARQSVVQLINQEPDLVVCGEAEGQTQALRAIAQTAPDLVLLDTALKSNDGFKLLGLLKAEWPELAVLVFSLHDGPLFINRIIRAGASGHIAKQQSSQTLLNALRKILGANG